MHSPTTYAGIDWASRSHAVCVIDQSGAVIERDEVEHSAAGLRRLTRRLTARRVEGVAIERPDGPVIDALFGAGLTVVVIASRHVKALRIRYGLTGNKDDHADAYVLADVLCTDGHRLRPLLPDTPATVALRERAGAQGPRACAGAARATAAGSPRAGLPRCDRSLRRPRLADRAGLPHALPLGGADGLAGAASVRGLAHGAALPGATDRGRAPCPPRGRAGRTGPEAEPFAAVTLGYVRAIAAVREQIAVLETRIAEQLALHPDGVILTSLPRSGSVRAASLLAEIGDCRERFPTPEALACLAGAAPSTRQSGQHQAVTFRWACDKKLRDALLDFAEDIRFANEWAADVYRRAIERGKRHPHAGRILARAWVDVIWRCWQDGVPYDPLKHRALQRLTLAPAA